MSTLSLRQRYRTAVNEALAEPPGQASPLPSALVRACLVVLPVDGAGVSVTETIRVPVGASDSSAALAERLQTTLGEGPCLPTTATGQPTVADLETMARRWPEYHRLLVAHTPFRSVASLPLRSEMTSCFGALDLYCIDPNPAVFTDVGHIAAEIADSAAEALLATPAMMNSIGVSVPAWMNTDLVATRTMVWVALGMIFNHAHLADSDALVVLRAYASRHDLTLDEVATRMVTERLSATEVLT